MRLINRLTAASLIVIAALAIVLGFTLSSFLTRAVREWESESTAAFVRREIREAGLVPLLVAPLGPESVEAWRAGLSRLSGGLPGIVRLKVWNREGAVLWADDATLPDKQFSDDSGLDAALAGTVVARLRELPHGERFSMLTQVFVPILAPGGGGVLGVVEVHKIPTWLFTTLRQALVLIWGISLAGAVALWLVLRPLARHVRGQEAQWGPIPAEGSSRGAPAPEGAAAPMPEPTAEEIRAEIEARFGFFPPFFEPAMVSPPVLANLWRQTLSAYVDNPLPALFKEKLFAYLSRYCAVPYCIVCHTCALRPMGMAASEVLALLESPPPTGIDITGHLTLLAAEPERPGTWPEAGSPLEAALVNCCVFAFLHPDRAERCQVELRRLLGPERYARLSEFLGYVRTCHLWVEMHPELAYEADKRAQEHLGWLIEQEPRLAEFFRTYGERVGQERQSREERRITELEALAARLLRDSDATSNL